MSVTAVADLVDQREIALACVPPPHPPEYARRTGLHRQVEMLAHLRQIPKRLDHAPRHVPRVRAREPDALDAGDFVDALEQAGEVAVRRIGRPVVIDDLAE